MILSYLIVAILIGLFAYNRQMGAFMTVIWYPTLYCIPFTLISNQMTVLTFMELVVAIYVIVNFKRLGQTKGQDSFPFRIGFLATLISIIISYSAVAHINIISATLYVTNMMFPYFLWKLYQPSDKINKFIVLNLIIYVAVLSLVGFNETITQYNPLVEYRKSLGVDIAEQREDYERFGVYRAQSLTVWTSGYGVACGLGIIFLLNYWLKQYGKLKIAHYLIILICIASVFITGSRTIILMFAIGLLSILDKYKIKFQNVLLVFIILIIAEVYLPDYINDVIDSFVHTDEAGGSSVDMREYQLAAAMFYYAQSPVIGNGIGYMSEALSQNAQLMGGESIIYSLLVERGNIGIATFVILIIDGVIALLRSKNKWLVFFFLCFMLAKVMSLLPGFTETYIFFYLIPLIAMTKGDVNKQEEKEIEALV